MDDSSERREKAELAVTFKKIYRLHSTDVLAAAGAKNRLLNYFNVERFFAGQLINYVFLLRVLSFVCVTISTVGTLGKTSLKLATSLGCNFNKALTLLHLCRFL